MASQKDREALASLRATCKTGRAIDPVVVLELIGIIEQHEANVVDLQVRAMRSIAENVRHSLANYAEAVKQSPELRTRLAEDPAGELTGAFELIVRRVYAVIESAEKSARAETRAHEDGPMPETKESS